MPSLEALVATTVGDAFTADGALLGHELVQRAGMVRWRRAKRLDRQLSVERWIAGWMV